jgi:hypothetical protein
MSGVSLDVLDSLRAEGWATPTLDEVVQLGIFHITADLVRGFARAGYKGGAIETLVAFKIHGVTPEAIRDYAALGYEGSRRKTCSPSASTASRPIMCGRCARSACAASPPRR